MNTIVEETIQRIMEDAAPKISADELVNMKVRDVYFDMFCAPLGKDDDPDDLDSLTGPQLEGLICKDMNPNTTFKEIMQGMTEYKCFYDMINIADSDVRTRILEVISDTLNIDFNILYNAWRRDADALKQLKQIVEKL